MRMEEDDRNLFNGTMMERRETRSRRKRSTRRGYLRQSQHERLRRVEPTDHEYPETFGTEFLPEEHITSYPRTIIHSHSMTLVRSESDNARPIVRDAGLHYTAEEMVMGQASLSSSFPQRRYCINPSHSHHDRVEDVVVSYLPCSDPNFPQRRNRYNNNSSYDHMAVDQPSPHSNFTQERMIRAKSPPRNSYHSSKEMVHEQPCSRPVFPQRRRNFHGSPSRRSYSNYSRGRNSYYDEARHEGKYKRKHKYRAKNREDWKERDLDRSPKRKSRFSPKRAFKEQMKNDLKFSSHPKMHINKTYISKLENLPDDPKDIASEPVSISVNFAKISETKCSKKDGELRSATRSLKSSKDGESNYTKKQVMTELIEDNAEAAKFPVKHAIESFKYDAGATFTKDLGTKSSKRNAKANFRKKQEKNKSSEENAEAAILSKKLGDSSSKDDAGANFPEELVTKIPEDNVEANLVKNQATIKSSEENVAARLSKNLATKSFKDDAKANFAKEIVVKLCDDNTEAKLAETTTTTIFVDNAEVNHPKTCATTISAAKMPATTISVGNVDMNLAKTLAAVVSVDNGEANLAKTLATTVFPDNAEAEIIQKASDVKSSKSDQKGVQCKQNNDRPPVSSSNLNADAVCYFTLMRHQKIICRTKCFCPPIQPPSFWDVDFVKSSMVEGVYHLPQFFLFPAFQSSDQISEWSKFLCFLHEHDRVGVVKFEKLKIYVLPAKPIIFDDGGLYFEHALVTYDSQEPCDTSLDQRHAASAKRGPITNVSSPSIARSMPFNEVKEYVQLHANSPASHIRHDPGFESDAYVKGSSSVGKGTCYSKCHEAANSLHSSAKEDVHGERNFVCADPSYLKTLGQAHSGWIFGAIAELVDNSRDAGASRLDIAIETIYDKKTDVEIPMLCIIDDGIGMDHKEILRMISLGHKHPDEDNIDHIGRFGVGFKTGAMRLGQDALVLTQTTKSRSVAFLSQSLNKGKDNLEIPVVSYRRQAQRMEIDSDAQNEELAKYNLNAMKEFSPFDEYLIGEKAGLFRGNAGTQIYIWNLDKWGSDYTLEWQASLRGGSSFHQGDIFIRSRRVRTRPGQTSRKVLLDYSLRSYLEVIFLEPRMKIYIQDSLVRSRPLAKSLNNTVVVNDEVMRKQVQLTLGRCQIEWDEGNGGIFLYWHGRLIEAYKRVGGMIHSPDMGRGVIGVIDVTQLMDDGKGGVWVHSNKQGFQDCEPYAYLEEWLGNKADEYWDKHYDPVQAVQLRKGNVRYKPDNEWVQCDKCRKWRMLIAGFDSKSLPKEWFCYMEPFNGSCQMPEQKPGRGVITVGLKRSRHDLSSAADCEEANNTDNNSLPAQEESEDEFYQPSDDEVQRHVLKRLRRGPARKARKPLPLEVL